MLDTFRMFIPVNTLGRCKVTSFSSNSQEEMHEKGRRGVVFTILATIFMQLHTKIDSLSSHIYLCFM